jgi:hypothetical protein
MRWVEDVPPRATACGQGFLDIQGLPNAAAALAVARIGESAYVTAQVGAAVAKALKASRELAEQLQRVPTPELVYRLGDPTEVAQNTWRVPFWAFAIPRVP